MQKGDLLPRLDEEEAVGLREVARELRQQLRGGGAHRRHEAGLVVDAARIATAISGPAPWRRLAPATSRNASSSAMGSTNGVNDRRIAITWRLASRYVSNRGAMKTPSGQARRARAIGIADCTPNRRAS